MYGSWRSLSAADLDNDGDLDFVVGNMGLNNKFHPTPERPYCLYPKDIDAKGTIDLIPAYYIKQDDGTYDLFPGIDRTQFSDQVLVIKKKFLLNEDFANINMKKLVEVIGEKDLKKYKCKTLGSIWLGNMGNGKFKQHALPTRAQLSLVNAILATDVDHDGNISAASRQ